MEAKKDVEDSKEAAEKAFEKTGVALTPLVRNIGIIVVTGIVGVLATAFADSFVTHFLLAQDYTPESIYKLRFVICFGLPCVLWAITVFATTPVKEPLRKTLWIWSAIGLGIVLVMGEVFVAHGYFLRFR